MDLCFGPIFASAQHALFASRTWTVRARYLTSLRFSDRGNHAKKSLPSLILHSSVSDR